MEVGFSLGSNMHKRKRLLMQAKTLLLSAPCTVFLDQSSIYETTPVDVASDYQDMLFLNSCVIVESDLPLESWISYIDKIERNLGRKHSPDRNAPRPIDVDIIYAGDQIIDTERLKVPHPRWAERYFVVKPLSDIRPELILPDAKGSVLETLQQLSVDANSTVFSEQW